MRFLTLAAIAAILVITASRSVSVADAAFSESSGTFEVVGSEEISIRTVGPVTFFTFENIVEVTGTFTGTLECTEDQIVFPSGAARFFDDCTFSGTVDGEPGTANLRLWGSASRDGSIKGTNIVTGTGDLAGLLGVGHIEGADGVGTYSGRFRMNGGGGAD